jgi:hypothetical protein
VESFLVTLFRHVCGQENHSFEARYDLLAPQGGFQALSGNAQALIIALEAQKQKVYVRDVCVYCGKAIERQANGQ